ncbi:right-handed parallel beta-helix repeat-containing protein [Cellulomonas sp. 179-A 4D5 NHS]|uniref:right-handed parallel beta-helix repeat-containing protein n=1 Tax=Cellulomonas sp. 179-A 4D5 NHS TaxID=3142378 RepID=UPI0039A15F4D
MYPTSTAGLALALTLLASPAPGPTASPTPDPTPQPVACGGTITQDTVLAADLVCTEGDGLRLVGPVTLDLDGHTISGPGSGTGVTTDSSVHGVVTGGTIRGWERGVAARTDDPPQEPPMPATVHHMVFRDNASGIHGSTAAFEISWSRFVDNGTGVDMAFRADATVDRSVFVRNGTGARSGSDHAVLVTASTFRDNEIALSTSDGAVVASSSRFTGNTTAVSHFRGVVELTDNVVAGSEIGVEGSFGSVLMTSNTFRRNVLAVDGSDTMTLRGNRFVGNDRAVVATDPREQGVTIDIDGDTFTRNGDAIWASTASRIANVTAVRNTGWGIYAPNAVDGGGNVARANGNEPQCVGVVCGAR